MTPSCATMKPKLGFSIESLVGNQPCPRQQHPPSPSHSDPGNDEGNSPDDETTGRSSSPSYLGHLLPRAFLNFHQQCKPPLIQRPQPINGATQQLSPLYSDVDQQQLHAVLQAAKGLGGLPNPILPLPLGLGSLHNLHGIPIPPQFNPLMFGTPGPVQGVGAASSIPREYPLYPWLLSARHSRIFPPGLPSPEQLAYLLQPFRKPKRIRTAFSPSQLLRLEQAFEKNQYVVGQERRQLALHLNLSETQVKVWFQNRRTKEKRMQQDEEGDASGRGTNKSNEEDEEELDEEDIEDELEEERKRKEARRVEELGKLEHQKDDSKRIKLSPKYFASSTAVQSPPNPTLPSIATRSNISDIEDVILAQTIIGQTRNHSSSVAKTFPEENLTDFTNKNTETVK